MKQCLMSSKEELFTNMTFLFVGLLFPTFFFHCILVYILMKLLLYQIGAHQQLCCIPIHQLTMVVSLVAFFFLPTYLPTYLPTTTSRFLCIKHLLNNPYLCIKHLLTSQLPICLPIYLCMRPISYKIGYQGETKY